ncbi:AAA family ATPase [Butyrivibrio sp.]|uniref:AAA family ATPase n=1 Tax=Butyrivibrio sp. TaxID=28121 RepID=UPI0025BFB1FE|nr:AAA family ATPase [Butyrivibrio sp.]
MAYTFRDAIQTVYKYLDIDADKATVIEGTNERGIVYSFDGVPTVIFIYPISCKQGNKQNFFDTRDSGAKERAITWNYAIENDLRYFCFGVNEDQDRYKDYVLSLESDEASISNISFRKSESTGATGTQVNIPNDFIPKRDFERIHTPKGFYIAAIKKEYIKDYIRLFDNRPYMNDYEQDEATGGDEYRRAASYIREYISETGLGFSVAREVIDSAKQDFIKKFGPEALLNIPDDELLSKVFFTVGDNTDSLCCYLEMNKECRGLFGSISGGSSYKFGLFQKKDTGIWTTGSPQKPKELTEQEAFELGKEIVGALIKGAKIIEESELHSLEDYEKLDDRLRDEVGERFYNWAWFHKYYSIVYNDKLSSFHNNEWQNHVLRCFCIRPSEKYYARSGQIALIQNYADLKYREFIDAIRDRFGESKQFVRIGTTSGSGNQSFAAEWKEKSIVAIGWGQTGSLTEYDSSQGIDKQALSAALKDKYYPGDDSTSTRKAGELSRFYSTNGNTVFVAVKGEELIGLVDNIGLYRYESQEEFAHIKAGRWCVTFGEGEKLPNPSEGKLTSCYELSDEDNMLFLYKKYYYPDDMEDIVDDQDPEEYNKKMFRKWMEKQVKPEGDSDAGETYSSNSIDQYVSNVANTPLYSMSDKSVFFTTDIKLIQKTISELDSAEKKNNTQRSAVKKYLQYVIDTGEGDMSVVFKTNIETEYERNRIVFGAPGTGKSFLLKQDCDGLLDDTVGTYERVTFHPDYTYSQFVGTYKPVMDSDGRSIRYDFVPGPFMRVYVDALKSARTEAPQPHLLLIEEINRAKVAAVFGDVFQLLDRDADGVSEYEIQASEDIRRYLAKELGGTEDKYKKIRIPNNMFIWATMNSADQGVYPMDTAFKRRWNFEYLGIDEKEKDIENIGKVNIAKYDEPVVWNRLRKAINTKMSKDFNINEDKLMGPFFLSKKVLDSDENGMIKDPEKFMDAFKSKVIMYLYEDAVKQSKRKFFDGCDSSKYSSVCDAFDEIGMNIFGANFISSYYEQKRDDAE